MAKKKVTEEIIESEVIEVTAVLEDGEELEEVRTFELEDSNIILHLEGKKRLIIECDLETILGPSKSGKSDMIAATTGVAGIELPDMPGHCLQLKLYRVLDKKSRPTWTKKQ